MNARSAVLAQALAALTGLVVAVTATPAAAESV